MNREVICFDAVAPARERGLKSLPEEPCTYEIIVAPARERGLKSLNTMLSVVSAWSLPRGSVD